MCTHAHTPSHADTHLRWSHSLQDFRCPSRYLVHQHQRLLVVTQFPPYLITIQSYFDLLFIALSRSSVTSPVHLLHAHACKRTHTDRHRDRQTNKVHSSCNTFVNQQWKHACIHMHAHPARQTRTSDGRIPSKISDSLPCNLLISTNDCLLSCSFLLYSKMSLLTIKSNTSSGMMRKYQRQQTDENISNIKQNWFTLQY